MKPRTPTLYEVHCASCDARQAATDFHRAIELEDGTLLPGAYPVSRRQLNAVGLTWRRVIDEARLVYCASGLCQTCGRIYECRVARDCGDWPKGSIEAVTLIAALPIYILFEVVKAAGPRDWRLISALVAVSLSAVPVAWLIRRWSLRKFRVSCAGLPPLADLICCDSPGGPRLVRFHCAGTERFICHKCGKKDATVRVIGKGQTMREVHREVRPTHPPGVFE